MVCLKPITEEIKVIKERVLCIGLDAVTEAITEYNGNYWLSHNFSHDLLTYASLATPGYSLVKGRDRSLKRRF